MKLSFATRVLLLTLSVSCVASAFTSPSIAKTATETARFALPDDLSNELSNLVKPEDLSYTKQVVADAASKVKVDVGSALSPEASERLGILGQNFNKMLSGWNPNNLNNVASETASQLQVDTYGPWYVAVGCLFLAASQREAGREEARQDMIDKIVKGELDVEEMVARIKEEREAEARAKAEREAEIKRREEERIAKREAEQQRVLEEKQARADALAAKRAEQKAKADEKKRIAAEALAKKKAEIEAIRAERQAKLEAEAAERRRIAEEKKAAIEAKKLAKQEEIRQKAEERQLAIEMKRIEAEAKKQALADERAAALELKRAEAEAKKQAILDAKQQKLEEIEASKEEERLAAEAKKQDMLDATKEAKRLTTEAKKKAAEDAKLEVPEKKEVTKVVAEKKPTKTKKKAPATAKSATTTTVKASPLAKVLANERGIDITTIVGTGTGGRVLADDVRNHQMQPAPAPEVAPNGEVPYYAARETNGDDWSKLAPSTLKRKTIAELSEYLSARGAPVTDEDGKPLKKADLILEVLEQAWNTALV